MTLNYFSNEDTSNRYCKLKNLRNESDVEQNFLIPLLDELGYSEDYRESKSMKMIAEAVIGKGQKKKGYCPDFIGYSDKAHLRPVLIIDAKHPLKNPEEGVNDAQLYASVIRRSLDEPKPVQYCVGTNGLKTIIKHYDRDIEEYNLDFTDFVDGNIKFEAFKADMNRTARAKSLSIISQPFEYKKPDPNEIRSIFEACHKIIWRREFKSPVPAFWEFCKLMFVKLNEDKKLRSDPELKKLMDVGKPLPRERVIFSTYYIATHEDGDLNPIATIFRRFRNDFETKIIKGEKKRIFDKDEEIKLQPLTIRKVVELLEHHDLIKIDEDLNGRLFQTFLGATMRGRELGQYFTPRTVVEFMTDIAELKVSTTPPYAPYIVDACCGTGGFLIEAMAKMVNQIKTQALFNVLTSEEREKIEQSIKDKHLFGIDAGKDPPIARIARINMYLHGDGGSRIYSADSLDKKVRIEETLDPELRTEMEELQKMLVKNETQFQVALTNPPFSMRKKAKEVDQKKVLQDYESRQYIAPDGCTKIKSSLKSNVMFLERYHDLLENGGTLLSVIDESVLNTDTDKPHRDRMLKNYYVRAVISLPQWAFFEAGSNVKTSILFLEKKSTPSDDQPSTFYARSENIGYDMMRQDESMSDLPKIKEAYFRFKESGNLPIVTKKDWSDKSKFFIKKLQYGIRRIDFEWLDYRHEDMDKQLEKIKNEKGYKLEMLKDLISRGICQIINGKTSEIYVSQGVPIIKVRNVTNEGIDWNTDFVLKSFFDANPQSHLKQKDLLITSTGVGTIGRVAILNKDIGCMTDGHVTVIRIMDQTKMIPNFLAHYLRSIFGQIQMERYTVGSTGQTELNDSDIKLIKILYPEDISEQSKILEAAQAYENSALKSRDEYRTNLQKAKEEFKKTLMS
ncbi:MAG TPA: N-6 DNA methylase [Candidatus Bathyarchaeia archaeon]|nr:N-6 DNA methylase [Candidatus Bathyarchaeia archaeon]